MRRFALLAAAMGAQKAPIPTLVGLIEISADATLLRGVTSIFGRRFPKVREPRHFHPAVGVQRLEHCAKSGGTLPQI
jgi:hypothetical protein